MAILRWMTSKSTLLPVHSLLVHSCLSSIKVHFASPFWKMNVTLNAIWPLKSTFIGHQAWRLRTDLFVLLTSFLSSRSSLVHHVESLNSSFLLLDVEKSWVSRCDIYNIPSQPQLARQPRMMVGAWSKQSDEVSGMSSQSLYCFPTQVERTGSWWAFLCAGCGDSAGTASELCLSTLTIRISSLELGQGASGID